MSAPAPAFDGDSEVPVLRRKVLADDNTGKDVPFEELQRNAGYLSYDKEKFDFERVAKRMFGWDGPLDYIHEWRTLKEQLTLDTDTQTPFHRLWYDSRFYPVFRHLYLQFVREVILPCSEESTFAVQKDPSFRVNVPGNSAIGVRPDVGDDDQMIGLHCDSEYGHPPGEINFMVGLTDMFDSNSCWFESAPDRGDFSPVTMGYGQAFHFWGNKCRHHNKKNRTGCTRMSFDLRIIPWSQYDEEYTVPSLHGRRPFRCGGYFIKMEKGTLSPEEEAAAEAARPLWEELAAELDTESEEHKIIEEKDSA